MAHPMNILEGKTVLFSSGNWKGEKVILDRRTKKGIWAISSYLWYDWYYDTVTDEELISYCDDVKAIQREVNLNKIGI
jgi:hypothetical protein